MSFNLISNHGEHGGRFACGRQRKEKTIFVGTGRDLSDERNWINTENTEREEMIYLPLAGESFYFVKISHQL